MRVAIRRVGDAKHVAFEHSGQTVRVRAEERRGLTTTCSRAARIFMDELPREAYEVR
jgi:2-methylaconitate cis-trans-isomerase PrpF